MVRAVAAAIALALAFSAAAAETRSGGRTWDEVKNQLIDEQVDAVVVKAMKRMLDQITVRSGV